ncbi:MAG: hypothetical protein N2999_02230, partial [Proteobacteria bacterium]|nr:hypothetical protein [Pseudomonadota bacterium]
MITLSYLLKKNYRIIAGSIVLIYFSFVVLASIIMYRILLNNALTIATINDAYFENFRLDVENRAYTSQEIFKDVEENFKRGVLKRPDEIQRYLKGEYLETYDVAFISERGVIFDTTNPSEKNLDLSKFPDSSKSFEEAKNTRRLLIDYPVLNS